MKASPSTIAPPLPGFGAMAVATVIAAIATVALLSVVEGCGGKLPETRYYALAAPPTTADRGTLDVAVEPLSTEPGYDDDRIVYRQNPYRLDYYQYHRWSAAPGVVVGGYLAQALDATGKFRSVLREPTDRTRLVIGGRVLALEEIDRSKTQWLGHVVVELTATDHKTGEVVWTKKFDETEPLAKQSPEGLAQAVSAAMARIVASVTPTLGELGVAAK
jgi:ABC-type uncharacterized transport system auxiliary subunit